MSEDLFGNEVDDSTAERQPRSAPNDMRVVLRVIELAVSENGYLVSRSRVLRRVDKDTAQTVARWESVAVLHLIDTGHFKVGGTHQVRCGAVRQAASAVLVPKSTRAMLSRLRALHPGSVQHGTPARTA
jgi:hypothetical protein